MGVPPGFFLFEVVVDLLLYFLEGLVFLLFLLHFLLHGLPLPLEERLVLAVGALLVGF